MIRLLFLFVFILGIFLLSFNESFAQEVSIDLSKEKQATSPSFIEYNLAYPGILPDHPLYKLKVLRDRISAALISDPRKKIDFYLLQTDKGVLATAMLVDKKKNDLATHTAFKAEHNYTLLTYELYKLFKKPDEKFFKKLKTASLKHQEVLSSLSKRVSKEDKKVFQQVFEFSKRNWETVKQYQKRKIVTQ